MEPFGESGWRPLRDAAVRRWEGGPKAGPYQLGPDVRTGRFGPIRLAAHPDQERLLEFELYDGLIEHLRADPEGALMLDLGQVTGLRHRHLAPILGAGLLDGAPYVVRPHTPGRTLATVLDAGPLEPETTVGVLYGVAEALAFLAEEGPQPGACAMGGVDLEDVLLGFEGSIQLLGVGLKRARKGADAPLATDLASLDELATRLAPRIERPESAPDAKSWATGLRRLHPDACGLRMARVGRSLRARYSTVIPMERAALGLPTLH